MNHRIIPVLLIHKGGLYKTVQFKKPKYIGDPINAVRIFNEKEVDEIVILDIDASKNGTSPNLSIVSEICGEAFMPLAYGGGISKAEQAEQLFYNGVEKVVLNTIISMPNGFHITNSIANKFGNQSVIASIDIKKNFFGKPKIYRHSDKKLTSHDIIDFTKKCEQNGVGELFLNSVDRDGMYTGYDLDLIYAISKSVSIPVIICGGASTKEDFKLAEQAGASAMAAGSMFVFQRPHNAVLISYNV